MLKDDLIAVRALIAEPEHWTQGVNAKDREGYSVAPYSSNATCWCLSGAASKVVDGRVFSAEYIAISRAIRTAAGGRTLYPSLPSFNDNNDHETVLAVVDKAIANADDN